MKVGPTLTDKSVTLHTAKRSPSAKSDTPFEIEKKQLGDKGQGIRQGRVDDGFISSRGAVASYQRQKELASAGQDNGFRDSGFRTVTVDNGLAVREKKALAAYLEHSQASIREEADRTMGVLFGVDIFI